MAGQYFVSYSRADGEPLAIRLANHLAAGQIPVWVDQWEERPGEDWDEQIVEAIRTCRGLLFVMTADAVERNSGCKAEWTRALKYKKPVIPLRFDPDAELPLRLGSRQFVDFCGSFKSGLARLRIHLDWMDSDEGRLQALKVQLADAERELRRPTVEQRARIEDDIAELKRQIEEQQRLLADPEAVTRAASERIETGLTGSVNQRSRSRPSDRRSSSIHRR